MTSVQNDNPNTEELLDRSKLIRQQAATVRVEFSKLLDLLELEFDINATNKDSP